MQPLSGLQVQAEWTESLKTSLGINLIYRFHTSITADMLFNLKIKDLDNLLLCNTICGLELKQLHHIN